VCAAIRESVTNTNCHKSESKKKLGRVASQPFNASSWFIAGRRVVGGRPS